METKLTRASSKNELLSLMKAEALLGYHNFACADFFAAHCFNNFRKLFSACDMRITAISIEQLAAELRDAHKEWYELANYYLIHRGTPFYSKKVAARKVFSLAEKVSRTGLYFHNWEIPMHRYFRIHDAFMPLMNALHDALHQKLEPVAEAEIQKRANRTITSVVITLDSCDVERDLPDHVEAVSHARPKLPEVVH